MSVRAFFAVDIDDEDLKRQIVKAQAKLDLPDSYIKFVAPENVHLTLKFLGDIKETILPELQKEAEKISFEPFDLEFTGMGCFPNFNYINAIYIASTKGFGKLKTIAQHIESLSDSFNFKKEKREFKAHLTIGRLKRIKDKNQLVDVIQSYKETTFGSLKVTSFKLKKSELTPQGPIYSTLFEVKGTEQ